MWASSLQASMAAKQGLYLRAGTGWWLARDWGEQSHYTWATAQVSDTGLPRNQMGQTSLSWLFPAPATSQCWAYFWILRCEEVQTEQHLHSSAYRKSVSLQGQWPHLVVHTDYFPPMHQILCLGFRTEAPHCSRRVGYHNNLGRCFIIFTAGDKGRRFVLEIPCALSV